VSIFCQNVCGISRFLTLLGTCSSTHRSHTKEKMSALVCHKFDSSSSCTTGSVACGRTVGAASSSISTARKFDDIIWGGQPSSFHRRQSASTRAGQPTQISDAIKRPNWAALGPDVDAIREREPTVRDDFRSSK